jgi:hypothetical protein
MWDQLVWWACIGLESLLLLRAAKTRQLKCFPVFYSYIGCVLLVDLVAIPLFRISPHIYTLFFWSTELLTAVIGYGVVVEIFHLSLKCYAGVARFARIALFIIFLGVAARIGMDLLVGPDSSLVHAIAGLERYLRLMQAGLLVLLLALFVYYKIPVGRNLRGLILGYAFFIGSNVIVFTFILDPANKFAIFMREMGTTFYLITLSIWSLSLWYYPPEPVVEVPTEIEHDYEFLVRETRMLLDRARTHLARTARP